MYSISFFSPDSTGYTIYSKDAHTHTLLHIVMDACLWKKNGDNLPRDLFSSRVSGEKRGDRYKEPRWSSKRGFSVSRFRASVSPRKKSLSQRPRGRDEETGTDRRVSEGGEGGGGLLSFLLRSFGALSSHHLSRRESLAWSIRLAHLLSLLSVLLQQPPSAPWTIHPHIHLILPFSRPLAQSLSPFFLSFSLSHSPSSVFLSLGPFLHRFLQRPNLAFAHAHLRSRSLCLTSLFSLVAAFISHSSVKILHLHFLLLLFITANTYRPRVTRVT